MPAGSPYKDLLHHRGKDLNVTSVRRWYIINKNGIIELFQCTN